MGKLTLILLLCLWLCGTADAGSLHFPPHSNIKSSSRSRFDGDFWVVLEPPCTGQVSGNAATWPAAGSDGKRTLVGGAKLYGIYVKLQVKGADLVPGQDLTVSITNIITSWNYFNVLQPGSQASFQPSIRHFAFFCPHGVVCVRVKSISNKCGLCKV